MERKLVLYGTEIIFVRNNLHRKTYHIQKHLEVVTILLFALLIVKGT